MIQLINSSDFTILTNSLYRNLDKINNDIIDLRTDKVNNKENFYILNEFKKPILDLARLVNADYINDIIILKVKKEEENKVSKANNRLFVVLNNNIDIIYNENQIKLNNNNIFWSNEELVFINENKEDVFILIIDFEEFII